MSKNKSPAIIVCAQKSSQTIYKKIQRRVRIINNSLTGAFSWLMCSLWLMTLNRVVCLGIWHHQPRHLSVNHSPKYIEREGLSLKMGKDELGKWENIIEGRNEPKIRQALLSKHMVQVENTVWWIKGVLRISFSVKYVF